MIGASARRPATPRSSRGSSRPLAGRPRSEEARARVLKAALELLETRGLRALTIEAIAERAGTSKVTIYRWWSTKAAIALEAILAEVSPSVPYRGSGSALAALRDQMRSFARFLDGRAGRLLEGIIAEGIVDDETGRAFREHWIEPRRACARVLVARAIEGGELPVDVDVETVLDCFFGPLYQRFLLRHQPLTPAFAEAVFETVLLGVAPANGGHASAR